jgi:MSHA pilin protein MshC
VHFRHEECRGFTLIEMIASITIIAILAAVALPRMTAATPFAERGYADGIAASLRQSRAVALASGCEVQFTVDAAGYRAFQHAAAGTHCAAGGAWSTPVRRGNGQDLNEAPPAGVTLANNRQLIFAADGTVAAAPLTITVGLLTVTVDATGLVQGP